MKFKKTLQKYRNQICTSVYFLLAFAISFVIYSNSQNHTYYSANPSNAYAVNTDLETERLSLPKGEYQIAYAYTTMADTAMTIYIDDTHQITGTLPPPKNDSAVGYAKAAFTIESSTDQFHTIFSEASGNNFALTSYDIIASQPLWNDDILFAAVFMLFAILLYILLYMIKNHKIDRIRLAVIFILVSLMTVSSYPLFTDFLVQGHDLSGHLLRIEGVKHALLEGQFPPMLYPEINQGYGLMGFLYPNISLLIPASLRMMDVSIVTAYQFFLVLINIATVLAMFFSTKSICKSDKAATITAILYTLAPYRLNDIYIRSALGETLALIFVPIVLAGLYHIFLGEQKKWYLLVIGCTGILQSHVLSCLFVALISFIMFITFIKRILGEKRYISLIKAVSVFLLINLWYLLPFWAYSKIPLGLDSIANDDFYNDTAFVAQLFMTKASTYASFPKKDGIGVEMQMSLGLVGGAALLTLAYFLFNSLFEKQKKEKTAWLWYLFGISVLMIIMASNLFPWQTLDSVPVIKTVVGMIQYSFRFLGIATACISMAAGIAVEQSDILRQHRAAIVTLLTVLSCLSAFEILDTYITQDIAVKRISGGFDNIQLTEYWPEGITAELFKNQEPVIENATITDYTKNGTHVSFSYQSAVDGSVTLPLLFYPGYSAQTGDGKPVSIVRSDSACVRVELPANENITEVKIHYDYWNVIKSLFL